MPLARQALRSISKIIGLRADFHAPARDFRVLPELLNVVLIVLGVLSASMGLHGFLLSSNFIDGGVTGVSMLVSKMTGTPLSVSLPVVQPAVHRARLPPDRRRFALRSALAIGGLSLARGELPLPRRHARPAC